jgi:hypothetical protein
MEPVGQVRRHRALNITPDQFHDMRKGDDGAMQEKHADAIDRMYEVAELNLKTATEAEKAALRLRLLDEARKGGNQVSGLTNAFPRTPPPQARPRSSQASMRKPVGAPLPWATALSWERVAVSPARRSW